MIKKLFFMAFFAIFCIFIFCSCVPRKVGEFFSLQEAYEKGIINKEELMSIAYYCNGDNKGVDNEYFIPIPISPETLSDGTKKAIKETKAYCLRRKSLSKYSAKLAKIDDVEILNYYGTYKTYIAIMMIDAFTVYDDSLWEIVIDEVTFFYKDGNRIYIWKAN